VRAALRELHRDRLAEAAVGARDHDGLAVDALVIPE
jgi:hypothetical protein